MSLVSVLAVCNDMEHRMDWRTEMDYNYTGLTFALKF